MWNPAPRNYGFSANTKSSGGIPALKPKWIIDKLGRNNSFYGMIVASKNSIYICSSGDTYSIDFETGSINWASEVGNRKKTHRGMAIIENYLLSDWILYDCITGKLLFDYKNSIDSSLKNFSWTWIIDGKFLKKISPDSKELLTIDPKSKEISRIESELKSVVCVDDKIYGWSSKNHLTCYDTEENKDLWSLNLKQNSASILIKNKIEDIKPSMHLINGSIFLFGSKGSDSYIVCIDSENGHIIWEIDSSSENSNLDGKIARISVSDDFLYFTVMKNYVYRYVALGSKDGLKRWEVEVAEQGIISQSLLISGDLVFHGKIVDTQANTELFAMDRFTGKVVWIADDLQMSTHGLIGCDNKIIYTNTFSEVRCYEWVEEYKSAFRDKDTLKLVSNNNSEINNDTKKTSWFNKIFK